MNVTFGKSDSSAAAPRQIRFVHNQGQPPSKRRRINAAYVPSFSISPVVARIHTTTDGRKQLKLPLTALLTPRRCLTCRRRKTRCDGERPTCSTCSKNGHKCLGYPEDSKRDDADDAEHDTPAATTASSSSSAAHTRPPLAAGPDAGRASRTTDRDAGDRAARDTLAPAAHFDAHPRRSPAQPSSVTLPPRPPFTNATPPTTSHGGAAANLTPTGLEPSPSISSSHPPQTSSTDDAPPLSPTALRRAQSYNHRIPYFRYFGPTAIVPGFKQMVVSVRDRRMSTSGAGSHPGTSPMSTNSAVFAASSTSHSDVIVDDLPSYDPNSPGPVHPLLIHLVEIFFTHVGCNFPFLKMDKLLRHIREKRVEPILVDAICALAARFSDSPSLTGGNDKLPRTERGHIFAQRAKQATVDTFACPSVEAVQACLLMAYEGFGANQDSALWMYLGLAIRMALDLGLQKRVGIKYQGEKDPWNTQQQRSRGTNESESPEDRRRDDGDLSEKGQRELEQERIDTFWAVFVLDRIISSGTGRPVTLRDDDFELPFPEASTDPHTGWPTLFPVLVQIVHLYGRVSDVLNNIHHVEDLTQDRWSRLSAMEHQLTRLYKNWGHRLQFNVNNFKHYLKDGQGNIFILLHLWFHALFINLHQPTVLMAFGELRSELQLLPDSRELSMSSAKTICDILSFADLIDPKSFIGNPFTSQPIYIAAGAFLMESSANASEGPSREASPPPAPPPAERKSAAAAASSSSARGRSARHSLLASAATQNYQRCYNSLQEIHGYWGGIKYILTALDQKSKGTRDVETYTTEEYESTKTSMLPPPLQASIGDQLSRLNNHGSPIPPGAFAWSFSGTANSPNSNFTVMYQTANGGGGGGGSAIQAAAAAAAATPSASSRPPAVSRQASTPPGNMVYDPIRQSMPETSTMFPPAVPQPNLSALRHSPHNNSRLAAPPTGLRFDGGINDESKIFAPPHPTYTPTSQHSNPYEAAVVAGGYSASPPSGTGDGSNNAGMYGGGGGGGGMQQFSTWGGGPMMGQTDGITFNSHDIDVEALGLQQELMSGSWLELTTDMLGLFESPDMNNHGS